MRRRLTALVAGLLAAASAPAHAQTNFFSAGNLPTTQNVGYHFFQVTTAGTFDIFTTSSTGPTGTTSFDPQIYLFGGLGTGGSLLGTNDDGCSIAQCGGAISFSNALIDNISLTAGYYTVAVGDFFLSEADARDGFNNALTAPQLSGGYRVYVTSGNGRARDVPEPSSLALLAAGLFGMGAVVRRRRAA